MTYAIFGGRVRDRGRWFSLQTTRLEAAGGLEVGRFDLFS